MDSILSEIKRLENLQDIDGLSSYLIDLAKHGENPLRYENEFKKHFESSDWVLRKASVFCLLFALQIDKPEYRKKAIKFVMDESEDEEVRRWAASGLAQTYQNTKDKELLRLLMSIVDDDTTELNIKESFISSILLIFGLSSRDQFLRSSKMLSDLETLLKTFDTELADIRRLIK